MNRTIGLYEIRGIAGGGETGVVHDGWDPQLGRRVAVKLISISASDGEAASLQRLRFQRGAEVARSLVHPNIVQVFDYGETDEGAYLVTEFVDGQSLQAILDGGRRFSAADTLAIMHGLLSGLGYSHSCGAVHRDITPASIMITHEGVVKITDFEAGYIEGSSIPKGSAAAAYRSPEQFLGETMDARSDIYSAGAVLFQLLTGERPFDGSLGSVMSRVLRNPLARPSEVSVHAPPALDPVVACAMARDPNDRFATAAKFVEALDNPVDTSISIPPFPPRPPPQMVRQAAGGRLAQLAHIPAYVEPPRVADVGHSGLLRLVLWVAVIGSASLVGYDLITERPIGTLPNLQHLLEPPSSGSEPAWMRRTYR